jgi:hypothetical protein
MNVCDGVLALGDGVVADFSHGGTVDIRVGHRFFQRLILNVRQS